MSWRCRGQVAQAGPCELSWLARAQPARQKSNTASQRYIVVSGPPMAPSSEFALLPAVRVLAVESQRKGCSKVDALISGSEQAL